MTTQSQKFWNFSIDLYSQPQVAQACLELQDLYGIDINMLLFCYWHGLNLGKFPDATIQQAIEFSGLWKTEVVQPLRNVRRWMKIHATNNAAIEVSKFNSLRDRIKADELQAENYQQMILENLAMEHKPAADHTGSMRCCEQNLDKLLRATGISATEEIDQHLVTIAQGITLTDGTGD